MKQLRQYIRQILLTEAAITPDDLHRENAIVYIAQGYGDGMEIYYATRDDVEPMEYANNLLLGTVYIDSFNFNGRCGGGWMVTSSEAKPGWGPLLYDVAMEYATMNGGGLFPDRGSVSQSARKVWDYYLNKRPDVTAHQLDDPRNSLTPTEEDNCDQEVAGLLHSCRISFCRLIVERFFFSSQTYLFSDSRPVSLVLVFPPLLCAKRLSQYPKLSLRLILYSLMAHT